VVYIREAHPTDGRQVQANVQDGILIEDPKSLEEREKVAREFAEQFRVSLPILVDTLDDQAEKAFAAWPDRIYVVDPEGKIAYKGGPGPRGFNVGEAAAALERVLEGQPPDAPEREPLRGVPPMVRDRLLAMLERAGLEPAEREAALRAVGRKAEAYRAVMEARRALFTAGEAPEDVARVLEAYGAATQKYVEAAAKLDRELEQAIEERRRPAVIPRLVAIGVYGIHPAPPFGMAGPGGPGGRPGRQE
jgi:hypothetical protein